MFLKVAKCLVCSQILEATRNGDVGALGKLVGKHGEPNSGLVRAIFYICEVAFKLIHEIFPGIGRCVCVYVCVSWCGRGGPDDGENLN